MRLYRFTDPALDAHAFRQTQTASTVWLWREEGFDFLSYHVPMFGGGQWVLELPTYQAIVYGGTLIFGFHEWVGRAVSIAAFIASAWLLYRLMSKWTGTAGAAVFSVFFLAFLPLTVFFFRAFMIDPLVIAMVLAAALAATELAERWSWPWMALLAAAAILAVLTKATIVAVFLLPLVILGARAFLRRETPLAGRLTLVGTALVTLVLSILWRDHSDRINIRSNGMSFSEQSDWYFGSTIEAELWTTLGQRFLDSAGILALAVGALGIVAASSLNTRYRVELYSLLVSLVASTAIFANLNRVHDYYQFPHYVVLSMFGGIGLWTIYVWFRDGVSRLAARQAVAAIALILVGFWMLNLFRGYYAPDAFGMVWREQGVELATNTPDDRVVLVHDGGDANEPMLWYEARRTGWRVTDGNLNEVAALYDEHDDVGAIARLGPPEEVPPELDALAERRGLERTYESPGMVVFSEPMSAPTK